MLARSLIASAAIAAPSAAQNSLDLLPTFGDQPQPFVNAMTPDGSVAVGSMYYAAPGGGFRQEAARWERIAGGWTVESLGDLPGGAVTATAWAVSDDGGLVVGTGLIDNPAGGQGLSRAFRWTAGHGLEPLPVLPAFNPQTAGSWGHGVTPDGSLIVGGCGISGLGGDRREFRLFSSGVLQGQFPHLARAVSADGVLIAGNGFAFVNGEQVSVAWRWNRLTEPQPISLGLLPGGDFAECYAMSRDGATIVGTATTRPNGVKQSHGFVWTPRDGIRSAGIMGSTTDPLVISTLLCVNNDGDAAGGGYSDSGTAGTIAAVWTPVHGLRAFQAVVEVEFGLPLPDLRPIWFSAIAPSGGHWAFNARRVSTNQMVAAVITLDGTCYADCNADSSLTVADFGCFQTRFVQGDAYADCNADGARSVQDFGCFQTKFVQGCP